MGLWWSCLHHGRQWQSVVLALGQYWRGGGIGLASISDRVGMGLVKNQRNEKNDKDGLEGISVFFCVVHFII
jgi:hypothetical protein